MSSELSIYEVASFINKLCQHETPFLKFRVQLKKDYIVSLEIEDISVNSNELIIDLVEKQVKE